VSRSPLAYPLNRSADTDGGGAADLQTDVMRFMAILALCLVAIFALVQSIPLAPVEQRPEVVAEPAAERPADPTDETIAAAAAPPVTQRTPPPQQEPVVLTRPKWVPKYQPAPAPVVKEPVVPENEPVAAEAAPTVPTELPPTPEPEKEGFTLRFASDAALARAVAAHHVGFYAITASGAKRMTVNDSRISFWDASTPNAFHEMETTTVPTAVVRALARTGIEPQRVNWGVTLPGKMTVQLDTLMREHRGGSLIIAATGEIHWEAS
jgi:hypothetical protein